MSAHVRRRCRLAAPATYPSAIHPYHTTPARRIMSANGHQRPLLRPDKGIDGVIRFIADPKDDYKRAIVSVKGGEHVGVLAVRDLKGVLDREGEPIGILLMLNPPTKDMVTEAAASGFYESEFWKKRYPRVQILTVPEVLNGKRPDMPWGGSPFAKAPVPSMLEW